MFIFSNFSASNIVPLKSHKWGPGSGREVKFACSQHALAAQDLRVQIPGTDLPTAHRAMLWWRPTYKQRKIGTGVSSGTIFLTKKKKEITLGAGPVAQRLSLLVLLLSGLGFAGSVPRCGHGTAWHAMLW